MSPEEKFLFYRKHIADSEARLGVIHTLATHLQSILVVIPQDIADNLEQMVHFDSRGDEAEAIDMLREHIEKGVVGLFETTTLLLLTEAGVSEYRDSDEVTCSNLSHALSHMEEQSRGYATKLEAIMQNPNTDAVPSFDGFYPAEVDAILGSMKGKAERRIVRLRDIHTQMKYLKKKHIWPNSRLVKAAPKCPESDKFSYSEHHTPKSRVLSEWWMTTVCGNESVATEILLAFDTIDKCAAPRPGEPDSMNYFGSHVSNKLSVEPTE